MGKMSEDNTTKPVIELPPSSYQPSKAELEEEIHIPMTPEELARAVGRQVVVREIEPEKLRLSSIFPW